MIHTKHTLADVAENILKVDEVDIDDSVDVLKEELNTVDGEVWMVSSEDYPDNLQDFKNAFENAESFNYRAVETNVNHFVLPEEYGIICECDGIYSVIFGENDWDDIQSLLNIPS